MRAFYSLFLVIFCCLPARAGLTDLIKKYEKDMSVVTYIKGSNEYGLTVFKKKDEFKRELRIDPASGDFLANDTFIVVEDTKSEPLPLTDFDGRNTLYHLEMARRYFQNLDPENPALSSPAVVRVRMNKFYNPVTHFAEWDSFNNARFIPAHYGNEWGQEIWFHKRKGKLKWKPLLVSGIIGAFLSPVSTAIALPIRAVMKYRPGLDSAKVPTVIYHEAFHWVSNTRNLIPATAMGNAVGEDYANYFAASLHGKPEVGEIGELSGREYRRKFSKNPKVKVKVKDKKLEYNSTIFVASVF